MPPPPHRSLLRRLSRLGGRVLSALDLSRLVDRWADRWAKARFRRERQKQAQQLRDREALAQSAASSRPASPARTAVLFALRRSRRWVVQNRVWIAVVGVAVLGVVGARPAWGRIRQWRCDRLVAEARTALIKGDWKESYHRSASALMLRDTDREAAWIFLQAMREMGNPKAVELGYWLFAWPQLPKDRRQQILGLFADRAPEAAFFGAFNSMSPEDRSLAANRALLARALIRRGDHREAEALLRGAPDLDSHPALQIEFIRLLCTRQGPGDVDDARRRFLVLRDSPDPVAALEALRLLHAVPGGTQPKPAEGFPVLDTWLSGLPHSSTRDRLIAADQRLADGTSPELVVSDVVDHFGRFDPGETAAWLNRHGRHDQAIALATPTARQDPIAFTAVVEAQAALLQRDAARRTLATPPPGFHPVDLALLHLRLANLGNEDEIREAWASVLRAAEQEPDDNRGYELVALAEAAQRPAEREKALSIALRHRWGTHPLYQKIEPLLASLVSAERTWEILEICRNIARYEPENAPLQNNVLYLEFLSGQRTAAQTLPPLQKLQQNNPGPDFALSLAFVLLADHQSQRALDLVTPLQTQPGPQSFLRHAIAGTALHLLGRAPEAAEHLRLVSWDTSHFLPQEADLFRRLNAPPPAPPPTTAANPSTP